MRSLKQQRQDARVIFEAGLVASDPELLIGRRLQVDGQILYAGERLYNLANHGDIYDGSSGRVIGEYGFGGFRLFTVTAPSR